MSNLLQETGDALLLETGDNLLLDEEALLLATGHIHVGKFITGEPLYTIENEIISHDDLEEGQQRPNVVLVDGQEHSWQEFERADLVARDQAVHAYFDVPELTTAGAVRQRALEEIQQARSSSSPGGEIAGTLVLTTTRMDPIFWIDTDGNKYQTRIEGKSVSFSQGLEPTQKATIDNGTIIFCPPEGGEVTYVARDLFDRDADTDLGTALIGGDWTIY